MMMKLSFVLCALLPAIGFAFKLKCHAISKVVTDEWCNENCNLSPPNCPAQFCQCETPPPPPTPAPPPTPTPKGDTWAVLAAGSSTYWNYRHQADVCHAYQLLVAHGVKAEHIILMMYDDVAHSKQNPFPGKLFNEPKGHDVYTGCKIDYKGDALSPALFKNVLLGNADAVKGVKGTGKVLKSGPNDRVFINFADHGGPGMIMFPGGSISANDILSTIKTMHSKKMYKQLMFYLDTCESGSMFVQLPTNINALAVTSANPGQPANAIWCYSPENIIQGKSIGACLGDVFSVGWMIDSDHFFDQTIAAQVKKVRTYCYVNRCNPVPCISQVCEYGDKSIEREPIGWFQGQPGLAAPAGRNESLTNNNSHHRDQSQGKGSIPCRDVKHSLLKQRWVEASDEITKQQAWKEYDHETKHRDWVDRFFTSVAVAACEGDKCNATSVLKFGPSANKEDTCKHGSHTDLECHDKLIHVIDSADCKPMAWGDYSAKYAGLFANLCDGKQSKHRVDELTASISEVCHAYE